LLWKDVTTSLLEGTTKFKMGIMFTTGGAVLLQDEGKMLLKEVMLGSNANLNNICRVFHMMLASWLWLKMEMYWICGEVVVCEAAGTVIRTMLQDLLRLWP
jgi:hypothetical protein